MKEQLGLVRNTITFNIVFKQELISTLAVLGYLFDSVLSPASWHTVQPVNTKTHEQNFIWKEWNS